MSKKNRISVSKHRFLWSEVDRLSELSEKNEVFEVSYKDSSDFTKKFNFFVRYRGNNKTIRDFQLKIRKSGWKNLSEKQKAYCNFLYVKYFGNTCCLRGPYGVTHKGLDKIISLKPNRS